MGRNKDHYVEPKSAEVKSLRKRIAKLENENRRLKSELRTYEDTFRRTVTFMKKGTENLSIQQLVKGVDADETLFQIKEKVEDRWKCHKCHEGKLSLIIVPGNRYFRRCAMCTNKTELQTYHDEVEQ